MAKHSAFGRHKIPYHFEYSDRLVQLLRRIAATKPNIEQYLGNPLEVQLLRQAKILAITYSNQIEGNRLEERGVTQALEQKSPKALPRKSAPTRKSSTPTSGANTVKRTCCRSAI